MVNDKRLGFSMHDDQTLVSIWCTIGHSFQHNELSLPIVPPPIVSGWKLSRDLDLLSV
jgi:hypothetical protein